ncbi:MAG: hypothetical protein AAGF33_00135 [Pseudomonadota bacterium]
MRPDLVVELDSITDGAAGMSQGLEAMTMDALLHHAVLLWIARRDELLL